MKITEYCFLGFKSLKNNGISYQFVLDDVEELSNLLSSMKKKMITLDNMIFKAQKSHSDCLLTARVWADHPLPPPMDNVVKERRK